MNGFITKKITPSNIKVGQVYLCNNIPEIKRLKDIDLEVTLCRYTKIDQDFVYLTDYRVLEGESDLTEWLFDPDTDIEYYTFYHITKENHPEEYL